MRANYLKEFEQKVKSREFNIAVVGLGYVGLPLALEFAKKGFSVLGIDVDKDRIKKLDSKQSYITDISNAELSEIISGSKFKALDDFKELVQADCIFICVPTPLKKKYQPDISFIKDAVKEIAKFIKPKSLVILESTTYPGTTEEVILPLLETSGLKHGKDFFLCFSPERIDPGNVKFPLSKIPKVIGGINQIASQLGKLVYESILDKVTVVSSTRVAECVKLLENTFRIVNIALIDEMSMMANKMGVNIWEIIEAAKTKPFGFMPFYPGPGVGGHCIPKDPLYLYWKAKSYGFKSRFIKLSSDMINYMPVYVVERVGELLAKNKMRIHKAKILIMGVTYKRDVLDLRKSPSLDVIRVLLEKKAKVSFYDPLVPYLKIDKIDLERIDLTKKNLRKFDCVVITTDHTCVDYDFVLRSAKLIFDARNVYGKIKNKKVAIL